MEARVRVQGRRKIAACDGVRVELDELAERARDPRSIRTGREPAQRRPLDRLAKEQGFFETLEADARDVGASLRPDVDQALVGESHQRLAHRCAAGAEPRRDLALGEHGARRHRHFEDGLAQPGVDALALQQARPRAQVEPATPRSIASFASDR